MRRDSRTRETVLYYRKVYLDSPEGRWALARFFESCGLLRRIENDEQRVMHNQAVYLLENMGLTQGANYDRLCQLLGALTIPDEALDER